MVISTIGVKVCALLSQFLLGWILVDIEFGAAAIALTIAGVSESLSGAVRVYLIQKGSEYLELAGPLFRCVSVCNIFLALILSSFASRIEVFYDAIHLKEMIYVSAMALVLRVPSVFALAKLSIALRFSTIVRINTASGIIRNAALVIFALLGFGSISFVLPTLVVAVFEGIVAISSAGWFGWGHRVSRSWLLSISSPLFWGVAGALGIILTERGAFLVVGSMLPASSLGSYFFAYQLTISFSSLLATALTGILMPSLSSIATDRLRVASAFTRTVVSMVSLLVPACLLLSFSMPSIVALAWNHKWDEAAVVVGYLCIGLIFRLVTTTIFVCMQSIGEWRAYAVMLLLDAFAIACAAYLGCLLGNISAVAIAVVCAYISLMFFYLLTVKRYIAFSLAELLSVCFRKSAPIVAIYCFVIVTTTFTSGTGILWELIAPLLFMAISFAFVVAFYERPHLERLWLSLKSSH